jgi:hypothetical protein
MPIAPQSMVVCGSPRGYFHLYSVCQGGEGGREWDEIGVKMSFEFWRG